MNEPADPEHTQLQVFYKRVEKAIREVDPDHILFLDGNTYSMDFSGFEGVLPNCVYAMHDYATMGFPAGEPYVGSAEQDEFLQKQYERKVQFMKEHKVPVSAADLVEISGVWLTLGRSGTASSGLYMRMSRRRTTRGSTTSGTVFSGSSCPSTRKTRLAGASGSTRTSDSRVQTSHKPVIPLLS
jgi:hypothetical protein